MHNPFALAVTRDNETFKLLNLHPMPVNPDTDHHSSYVVDPAGSPKQTNNSERRLLAPGAHDHHQAEQISHVEGLRALRRFVGQLDGGREV